MKLTGSWWPGSQTWQTNGLMVALQWNLIVKEQLINTLPENIRVYVKEQKLTTSQEAGELADDHIRARKDEESKLPKTPLPTRCS